MTAAATKSRSDERREGILRVAGEVFLESGYAATSMSTIAARLGGSKGTLYSYFTCKSELFAAFMTDACLANSEAAFGSEDDGAPVDEALRRIGRGVLKFLCGEQAMAIYRLVVAEAMRFPELGRAFYEAGPKVSTERLASWLERRMERGELRRADTVLAARQFFALCKSGPYALRLWNVEPPLTDEEIAAHIDTVVEMFLAAYGVRG